MTVSVIIPTYNERSVLQKCLESLSNQSFKNIEVVVVDDGSTDGTPEKLITLKQNHLGAGEARNNGAKNAKGEILVFVDADMTFEKNFIKKLIDPIVNGKSKGTFSKNENVSNWDNKWARCWNINENWEDRKRHPKNYPNKQPVFRAILKSEFKRIGGFTSGGYDDDWSLSDKLGYQADLADNAVFFHKNPDNLMEIFKHAKWVGKRKHKLGKLGDIIALFRSTLPFSLLIGLYKSLRYKNFNFIVFKIIYDLGNFFGILEFLFTGKKMK